MFIFLNQPICLALWLLVPAIWFVLRRFWAQGISSNQKIMVGGLRSFLIVILGLALSDPQLMRYSERVNLIFCLDVSASIPREQKLAAEAFIEKAAAEKKSEDQTGVIVFGKHPSVEISLKKDFDPLIIRSAVNSNYTNIYSALRLAIGKLTQRGTNKIVLFSDGNENLQRSRDMAYLASSLRIEIYPVPLTSWFGKNEAFIKALQTPPEVALETPFEIRLLVISSMENQGQLVLVRDDKILVRQSVHLQTGMNLLTFGDKLTEPGLYLYKAILNSSEDTFFQNNEGLSFTRATHKSGILYLTDESGGSQYMVQALKVQGLDIDQKRISDVGGSLHGFINYNAIILDNISARSISFSTMEQIEKYVNDMGGGLIMIGGDKSFGAGHYKKTPVENALPVYMDVPTDIQLSELVLIFIVDKSSSMATTYNNKTKLEMAKIAAFSAVQMLNPVDNVGVVTFDTEFNWIVPLTKAMKRQMIADKLSQVLEGGGTDLYPAIEDAFRVLNQVQSKRKHIIILSDGETEEADFKPLVQSMSKSGISISTVAIGTGSHVALMESIAEWGKGRAYYTDDPGSIPKIFTGETKMITKKVITEKIAQPFIRIPHEMLQGIEHVDLPLIYGQVVTYPKPAAGVLIETSQGPLLAAWQYGLGRSIAFTSDLSNRWGKDWLLWDHYGRFTSQMVKWVQRKEARQSFLAAIDREGEKGIFTVDVTSDQNRFANYLDLNVHILLPSGQKQTVSLDQIAPGRYRCAFPAEEIGAYFFSIFGNESLSAAIPRVFGFGIPYTEEFNNTDVNMQLLADLASTTNGRVLSIDNIPADLYDAASDSRRAGIPLWPYFTLAFLLFLIIDVAVRKLYFHLPGVDPQAARFPKQQ
jgi:uncharacterized membrane protein